jgi:hypothetical protein
MPRPRRLPVGRARVLVADVDGEEFKEVPRGFFSGSGNQRGKLRPGGTISGNLVCLGPRSRG